MPEKVTLNLATPGKFHVLNYAKELIDAKILNRLYFSHKSSSVKGYALDNRIALNFPIKEYLIQAHGRLLKDHFYEELIPFYHSLWTNSVLRNWNPAKIFHFISQGACLPLIKKAREDGALVICEVVNTHPENRHRLICNEAEIWGIKLTKERLYQRELQQIEEAKLADFILTPSGIVSKSYLAYGINTPACKIPYAANIKKFQQIDKKIDLPSSQNAIRIICVGHIGLRKGQLYLLEAVRRLTSRKIELTLVGTIDPLIRARLNGYADIFKHIERVPHSLMPALLATQDIFISASLEEGLAVSICEGMAIGVPVIATIESGAEEVIENGKSGLITPSRSIDALAEAIEKLAINPALRREIGVAAAQNVAKVHNWSTYSQVLLDFYMTNSKH